MANQFSRGPLAGLRHRGKRERKSWHRKENKAERAGAGDEEEAQKHR